MSCNNLSSMLKTCSESELGADDSETKAVPRLVEGSRLRRTFTLPRNPFGTAKSSGNKVKNDDFESTTNVIISDTTKADGPLDRKLFRRPSWKRFLNKIAQHMNTVSVSGVKHSPVMVNGDRVPISGEPPWPLGATPAATGIKNHGNTCYMNAVLQCLSHTDIIAEYFVLDHYKVDLQKRNKINSKKYGTRGEVTEELAALLKSLWTCQYTPCMSTAFKFAVDRHGPQYRGNSQHDAQEFLFWLLDKVHEDLNTATKKKYKIMKNTCGKPDEIVAAETLANHARRNSSFVQAVFQAQYRSALTCGRCERTSCTFDPFHCISVQLPPRQASAQPSPLPVNVVYVNQQPRQVLIGVELAPTATMDELKQTLHTDTGIELEHIILTEICDAGWSMARAGYEGAGTDCGALYCVEAPPLTHTPTQPYLLVLWINLLDEHRFGSVYAMQVARETCYVDLQKLMLKEMCAVVGARVLESSQPDDIFRARIAEPHRPRDPAYLQPELPHPLYALDVEQALNAHEKYPHLKLELLWNSAHRDSIIRDCGESCEVHVSAAQASGAGQGEAAGAGGEGGAAAAPALTLHACLHHYTRAERLAQEDAWRCPQCQRYMPVVKTLGLWSLPDVLVIHLKRFRQQAKGRSSTKLTTMVEFPLKDFDMTPHIVQRRSSSAESPGNSRSPKRRLSRSAPVHSCLENMYDLYAICYHHGEDLETGHYTAACKNPYDNHWYKFDDSRVSRVEYEDAQSELVNNSAYMLFYRRKKPNVTHTCSLMDGQNGHWALHMPKTKKMTEIAEAKDESEEKCHKADSDNDIGTDSSLSQSVSTLPDVITPKSAQSLSENSSPVKSANDNSQGRPAVVEINGNDGINDDQISVYENDVSSELHIHKDVHVNPKMTPVDTSREKRPKSVDYPKTNEPSGDVNRNYDSSPLVATINGLEYHPTTEELVLSMFQETKFIMSPLSREAHRPGEKTNAWKTRIST